MVTETARMRARKERRIYRPCIRYTGSKFSLAPWIESYFPEDLTALVVPFAGSLSEVLRWRPIKHTIVNDIDDRVVNFFWQLRDNTDALLEAIMNTPYHFTEYRLAGTQAKDPLEDARRFFVLCWSSMNGGPKPTVSSFRSRVISTPIPKDLYDIEHLLIAADRLKEITFNSIDAVDLVSKYVNKDHVMIYADPPYLKSTRVNKTAYMHESTLDLHKRLAEQLNKHKGYAIISGYDSDLYGELYPDWHVEKKKARVNGPAQKEECLWMNDKTFIEHENKQTGRLL